jgi:ADP-ribosylglycohydrolase
VPIPRYTQSSKYRWLIGETTDDTERTLAVARAIITDGGAVSHVTIGREMLGCTKCVHPGVRSLWEFHQANDPARVATQHDGCGAAIRVAPVGVVYQSRSRARSAAFMMICAPGPSFSREILPSVTFRMGQRRSCRWRSRLRR